MKPPPTALAAHFSRVVDKASISSWNSAIADLARSGNPQEALLAFSSLRRNSLAPDRSTLPPALKSAAALPSLPSGRQLHLLALRLGLTPDLFVASSLVDMYSKCSRLADARQVFDESPNRNAVVYTSLITGYIVNSLPYKAVSMFKKLLVDLGCGELDSGAMVSLLTASSRVQVKKLVGGAHGLAVKAGLEGEVSVGNTLMDAYAKGGDVGVSRKVFDGMGERDVVSWNSMVAVYAQNGLAAEALEVYTEMMRGGRGTKHNAVTLSAVLFACAHAGALQVGKCVHDQVIISLVFFTIIIFSPVLLLLLRYKFISEKYF